MANGITFNISAPMGDANTARRAIESLAETIGVSVAQGFATGTATPEEVRAIREAVSGWRGGCSRTEIRERTARMLGIEPHAVRVEEQVGAVGVYVPGWIPADARRAVECALRDTVPAVVAVAVFTHGDLSRPCPPAPAPPKPWRAADLPPTREERRREIDRVLADDARRFPAFARARMAGVLASCECRKNFTAEQAAQTLTALRAYESRRDSSRRIVVAPKHGERGTMARSRAQTKLWADTAKAHPVDVIDEAIMAYERARSRC